jgi:hyperosmotically inducible protein
MRQVLALALVAALASAAGSGCAPAAVGAGAMGAYKVGTDQRTVGQQWYDGTLTTKVKTALIRDEGVSGMDIDVDTVARIVYLNGLVSSQEEALRAEEVARGVPGVKGVKNNLRVGSRSFGESIDDSVLATKLRARLADEEDLTSLNVDIDVRKGVVSLTGLVRDSKAKNQILEIVRTQPGVVDVVDNMGLRK